MIYRRNIEALLSNWRARWSEQRKSGIKKDLTLPPLSRGEAQVARELAHTFYWSGCFVVYGEHKILLDDCVSAIANAADAFPVRMSKRQRQRVRKQLLKRDGNQCWYCGQPMTDADRTIEHLVPYSQGGSDKLANLVLAHSKCNHQAADLSLEEKRALAGLTAGEQS